MSLLDGTIRNLPKSFNSKNSISSIRDMNPSDLDPNDEFLSRHITFIDYLKYKYKVELNIPQNTKLKNVEKFSLSIYNTTTKKGICNIMKRENGSIIYNPNDSTIKTAVFDILQCNKYTKGKIEDELQNAQ